jgi:hypothetical protein
MHINGVLIYGEFNKTWKASVQLKTSDVTKTLRELGRLGVAVGLQFVALG